MTGFEPLIGAATAGLAGLIGKVITDKGSDLLEKADFDLFQGREFERAIQKYVRRYADRHGTFKVLCVRMDSPVKLDEIYTAVQLLPRSALRYFESTESLQELFRESGKRGFEFHEAEKKQGIEVANGQQYLVVLGGPGVGKSTFLRKMGLEALRRHAIMTNAQNNLAALTPQEHYYAHDCIPVMLTLQKFDSKTLSIKDVIAKEFEDCGFPKPQAFTELCLQSGRLLVLLDGLDEVPAEALNHAITEIENLVDRYDHNRFMASCRVAAYTFGGFRRFNDVAMAAFEDDQIERFIRNWFQKSRDLETETAKRCWELLSSPDYQAAKELAQTPLLLTLLCVIYDEFQDFPKKRHQVYGEALDVLLRKWAAEKRLNKEPIYQQFGSDLELELLSEIAYTSFVDDQLFFPKPTLLGQIQDFQNDNENAPNLDAGRVLYEIEVQQGILVERSRDAYSFSHLTFQEYLTAKCIVDNQKIEQLVRDHLTDQRWREVFLLVAGLAPGKRGAEDLLLQMETAARQFLINERLQALVNWADQETQQSPGQYNSAAKRTAALALALALALARAFARARARALALALALDFALDFDRARALALARTRARARALALAQEYLDLGIFKPEKMEDLIKQLNSLESPKYCYKSASKILRKAINLNDGLLDISEAETDALSNYFYAAELMIRCKEAAVRVSPQVWEGIESRILTVPTE
ncbi:MAG: NACHT domain-containing protein [Cyanobacteria bacterium P01_H01_bin.153]